MTIHRVQLQPGFILHRRPFRENSLIVNLLSAEFGQVSGIIRTQKTKTYNTKNSLQPFTPLILSWSGKTELLNIHSVETTGLSYHLTGKALLSGLYINELSSRLLPPQDPCPELYQSYHQTLLRLQRSNLTLHELQSALRQFEWNLLSTLGYKIELHQTQDTQQPILPNHWYRINPDTGILYNTEQPATDKVRNPIHAYNSLFKGEHLIAFKHQSLKTVNDFKTAKRLMRLLLKPLLGNRPLKSREFFYKDH